MDERLLKALSHDCRFTCDELAAILKCDPKEVEEKIAAYEREGVILGYKAIVNWEKADSDMVSALIEVKVTPQRGMGYDRIADQICQHDEVQGVYLMSGGYDLTVLISGHSIKDISRFVSEHLAPMDEVQSTVTHFMLKKYKEQGVSFSGEKEDQRGAISL